MTFNPYASPPYQKTSSTSKLAALSVEESSGPQGERVYTYIASGDGATREQVADALEMGIPSVCARVAQLLAAGRLHETDETRLTRSGRKAKVLRASVQNSRRPTFISLFSGIGGFDLGLERAGWECVAQCDNDPFANKVLAARWPGVKRYDDVRNVGVGPAQCDQQGQPHNGEADQPDAARTGHVDLICGGFPCQDLSVAGKRAGLDGARSGLWFEFYRILSELRPAFCVIENVPGLLSACGCDICTAIGLRNRRHTRSRGLPAACQCSACLLGRSVQQHHAGIAFGVVLAGLGQLWPAVGWVVLDSQHFGVAQRRRRLYVIGGPSRECVQQILSLCESGDWNTQARRAEREDVTYALTAGVRGTGDGHGNAWNSNYHVANTLLDKTGRLQVEETFIVQDAREVEKQQNGLGVEASDVMYTLDAASQHAVGVTIHGTDKTARVASYTDLAGSLRTKPPGTQENSSTTAVHERMGVRRLTPVECERLQGFPDGFTCICGASPYERERHRDLDALSAGESEPHVACRCPDGPRYKALGNAVSVPVIEYLGKRILEVL